MRESPSPANGADKTPHGKALMARDPAAARTRAVGRYRYLLLAVLWLAFFVGASDRATVSVLLADASFLQEMGLQGDPRGQGLLMTLLLVPYALSNVFLGTLADAWGPRRVLAGMLAAWAGAAAFMGAAGTLPSLFAGRIARGLAEGPLFPVANRYVRFWFPPRERGRANGIWLTGQRIGSGVAVPLLAAIVALAGWRSAFFLQAALLALFVLPAVWLLAADTPAKARGVGARERAYVEAELAALASAESGGRRGLGVLLGNYRYWLAVSHHLATLAVYNGLGTWLPQYLREERGFDLAQMAFFAALPYLLSTASTFVFGFVSDRFQRRAVFCTVGLAGAALGILLAALAPDPLASAVSLSLGYLFFGAAMPVYYAIVQRIIPGPIVATGIGVDNGLANLGGALAPLAVGFLIAATASHLPGLLLLAAVGLAGSLATAVLAWQRY